MRRFLVCFALLLVPLVARATVLSDAIAALSADSWGTISTLGISTTTLLETGGNTGFITGDSSNGCWDSVAQRAHFISKGHNDGAPIRHVVYDAATNTWLRLADFPFGSTTGGEGHAWEYGPVCDVQGRALYRGRYNSRELHKYNITTATWSSVGTPATGVAAYDGAFQGLAFHPERGTAGQVVIAGQENGTNGVLYRYDVALNNFARIVAGELPRFPTYSFAEYSVIHKVTMFGSGTEQPRLLYTNGTLTDVAAFPACGYSSGNRDGMIHAEPGTGSFVMLCGSGTASWHIYTPRNNTWVTKSAPSGITHHILNAGVSSPWPTWGVIGIPLTDHGAILYVKCNSSGCATRLYKGNGNGDFAARCSKPGVIRCFGFDDTPDFSTGIGGISGSIGSNFGIQPPFGTSDYTKAVRDTSQAASGASSLRFTIPSNSPADMAGSWHTNFSEDLLTQFGTNEDFYLQWRQRFSPEFLAETYTGCGGWKQAIIGTGDKTGCTPSVITNCASSCTDIDVVAQNTFHRKFPQMYHSCLGSTSHGPYDPFEETFGGDIKVQNARPSPFCLYSTIAGGTQFPPTGNCFAYFSNEWMTFHVHVHIGATRTADEWQGSHVDMWVGRDGQATEKTHNWHSSGPGYNFTAGTIAADQKFGKVWLTPYCTGKDPAQTHAVGFTWYDELIISRNPIADPGQSTGGSGEPPSPPALSDLYDILWVQ